MILYEYAERYHKPIVKGISYGLEELTDDVHYIEHRNNMLRKLSREQKRRNVTPDRCESHAKLIQVDARDDEVTADVQFRMKLGYTQYGENFEEEHVARERITLGRGTDGWRILRVEPFIEERSTPSGFDQNIFYGETPGMAGGSRPLLNTHLLYGWQAGTLEQGSRKQTYNRQRVKQYADQYWNSGNPKFLTFEVDCTNYVSQCLLAGGAPMNYTGRRESGWWYQGRKGGREWWSYSWSVSHALQHYLMTSRSGLQAELVQSPYELDLGDVIFYDWDGDGTYQHSTIVTGFDAAGEPLVNAHTANSRARLWSYRDSPAWTEHTRYRFFHIADYF